MTPENLPRHIAERIVADFGANTEFALQELEKYQADPASVGQEWQDYFAYVLSLPTPELSAETILFDCQSIGTIRPVAEATPELSPEPRPAVVEVVEPTLVEAFSTADTQRFDLRGTGATLRATEPGATLSVAPAASSTGAALAARSRSLAPVILPGDVVEPVRGGMLRIIENMEASLSVPTATSVREIPVRALEENRALVNRHRATMGAPKVSFTHIIAWAMIKALDTFPRLNDAYAEIDAKAHGDLKAAPQSTAQIKSELALVEHHDIVYREARQPGDVDPPPTAAPTGAAWQQASLQLVLPPLTRVVLVEIYAYEDVLNDAQAPEFDGHYADDVVLTLTLP